MTQQRWQKLMEWPLVAASVAFLVAYSWEVLGDLEGRDAIAVESVIWATWALFVVDYLVRLFLAEHRGHWFFAHLFDLAVVVLPILRPLRLLRLVTILAVLQRTAGRAFRGRVVIYAAGASVLLVYLAALAVLDAERGHGGAIQTFPEALWWAFVTITTVGYGDYIPVTGTGQLVAVGVMVGGISLIGAVTATFASWIVEKVNEANEEDHAATKAHIDQVMAELREIKALVGRE
ncbi:two pore domain potassium channel family protein [Agromyces protaetiae]|uniref:Two pore domain potassium channel family protein n=2 Tax=Agromyces protaetiae TaxID=2509455 RepID=A0A4V0YHI3_9MICO|nr:two pore domain potassium channel family protein [Agromyces protaetiae]